MCQTAGPKLSSGGQEVGLERERGGQRLITQIYSRRRKGEGD